MILLIAIPALLTKPQSKILFCFTYSLTDCFACLMSSSLVTSTLYKMILSLNLHLCLKSLVVGSKQKANTTNPFELSSIAIS